MERQGQYTIGFEHPPEEGTIAEQFLERLVSERIADVEIIMVQFEDGSNPLSLSRMSGRSGFDIHRGPDEYLLAQTSESIFITGRDEGRSGFPTVWTTVYTEESPQKLAEQILPSLKEAARMQPDLFSPQMFRYSRIKLLLSGNIVD